MTETLAAITAWSRATFQPKVAHIKPTMMGFKSGEINRKVRVVPNPALAESSPLGMGMVEQLQKQLAIPVSTLSHHIAALVSVGLVKQNRESRTLLCVSQYAVLEEIIAFFREECCVNSPGS